MKKHLIHFLLVAMLLLSSGATAFAQITVKGQVVDEYNEPVIGAAVTVVGSTIGVVTDLDGNFSINVAPNATIVIKFLGYKEYKKKITQGATVETTQKGLINLGVIPLEIDAFALDDVIVTSSIAVARKTPVAVSSLDPVFIEERIGMGDFPELLKATPSVYVTKVGGGFGDTEISLRGFKMENVAIMVNGVPMNGMENGKVYWSNWAGLSDVTRSKQIQRGLGASKVSAPSVGGSINIITNTTEAKKGGFVSYGMGEDGYNKMLFSVSTGLMKNGWAISLLGGKEWGDGYVQGTEYEGYSYFLNVTKRINDNHQLSLTAFGAPQWHNQRGSYDGFSIKGWQEVAAKYMEPGEQYRYNATYGFDKNGQRKTSARNMYHKPQISLNHMWQIDTTSSLSTALYVSIGDGYAYSGQTTSSDYAWYGLNNGALTTQFRNADGTFAYDKVQELNEQSDSGSKMIMSVSKNGHKWYGLMSTYTKELNENLNFYGGIDGRYYIGEHINEIIDLYNGAYYIDKNRANVKAVNYAGAETDAFKYKKLSVGDVVYRDYDGHVLQGGVFGQIEYSNDLLSAFVSGSLSNTSQWRYDRFYYDKAHAESDKLNKLGGNIKGGVNYNLNEYHNVFANVGYISRAPFLEGGVFVAYNTNELNPNAVNEKIFSFELGYGFQSKHFTANLNLYHTKWMDKAMANTTTNRDGDRATINMEGVDALHQGIEVEFVAKPYNWLDVKGMFSIGNWRWNSIATGYWYNNETGQPITSDWQEASGIGAENHAKSIVDLDGVKVAGAAQTTANLGVTIKPIKDIRIGLDWSFFGRNYSNYSLSSSDLGLGSNLKINTPWRIPSASTFDMFASYTFQIGGLKSVLSGNISNLFDQEYIQYAWDGGGTWEQAYRVFYGFGRRMNIKLKVNF